MVGVGFVLGAGLIQKDDFVVVQVIVQRLVPSVDGQQREGVTDDIWIGLTVQITFLTDRSGHIAICRDYIVDCCCVVYT